MTRRAPTMLSRTADHLFWMARYIERAENTARMLDVTLHDRAAAAVAAHAPSAAGAACWASRELQPSFDAALRDDERRRACSTSWCAIRAIRRRIYACLQAARENARAVRGTLTTEVWETLNYTWLRVADAAARRRAAARPQAVLRMGEVPLAPVARRHHRHDAAGRGLLLHAPRHLPRARRQHGAHPRRQVPWRWTMRRRRPAATRGAAPRYLDYYYWAAVLRSVSAFEIYRKVYRDVITPPRVAELLILRARHAALAGGVGRRGLQQSRAGEERPLGRDGAARRPAARRTGIRSRRRPAGARHARLPDGLPASGWTTSASASARISSCRCMARRARRRRSAA